MKASRPNNRLVFLANARESNIEMKVFLVNGTMLKGYVVEFDEDSIVLDKCLIEKEKIISISPSDK